MAPFSREHLQLIPDLYQRTGHLLVLVVAVVVDLRLLALHRVQQKVRAEVVAALGLREMLLDQAIPVLLETHRQ
jgi:hypothetical protein